MLGQLLQIALGRLDCIELGQFGPGWVGYVTLRLDREGVRERNIGKCIENFSFMMSVSCHIASQASLRDYNFCLCREDKRRDALDRVPNQAYVFGTSWRIHLLCSDQCLGIQTIGVARLGVGFPLYHMQSYTFASCLRMGLERLG